MTPILYPNEARVRKEFQELTAIDSESFNEREIADCLKRKLEEIGFTVREDDAGEKIGGNAGNLYATLKGDLPAAPVLLSSHMDTVKPGKGKKAIFHEDGIITSDGSTVLGGDDITGVTAILEGVRITREAKLPHRDLEILFCPAEEVYAVGSAAFDHSLLRAKTAFVLDSSDSVGTAILKAPTILSFEVKVHGKAAHAGFEPEKGIHAIQIMSRAISALHMGRLDEETTLNIGLIEGGSVTNAVPEICIVKGEIRSYNHDKVFQALEDVKGVFHSVIDGSGATVEIQSKVCVHAYHLSEDNAAIQAFDNACKILGKESTHGETFGGSDANTYNAWNIPSLLLSCGMYRCHTTEEYTKISDILDAASLVSLLIRL